MLSAAALPEPGAHINSLIYEWKQTLNGNVMLTTLSVECLSLSLFHLIVPKMCFKDLGAAAAVTFTDNNKRHLISPINLTQLTAH